MKENSHLVPPKTVLKKKETAAGKRRFLFLFIDGIGQGEQGPNNPFVSLSLPFFDSFFCQNPFVEKSVFQQKEAVVFSVDPRMQISGLPQSATGQTALFTGVNASKQAGGHVSGFPTQKLRELLADFSIFKVLNEAGYQVTSANAYSKRYFEIVEQEKWRKFSATTLAVMAAGVPFRLVPQLIQGDAVYHDIVNRSVRRFYPEVSSVTPQKAAANLAAIVRKNDFTLFEYFLTDVAGHRRNSEKAAARLLELDAFLGALMEELDLEKDLLMITSDHGNIEDSELRTHTMNNVPLILIGEDLRAREIFSQGEPVIEDIYHKIIRWFDK